MFKTIRGLLQGRYKNAREEIRAGLRLPEEEENEIAATLIFIKVIRKLIDRGAKVDCIDTWFGPEPSDIQLMSVDLSVIEDDQFRFFENYHFLFV